MCNQNFNQTLENGVEPGMPESPSQFEETVNRTFSLIGYGLLYI